MYFYGIYYYEAYTQWRKLVSIVKSERHIVGFKQTLNIDFRHTYRTVGNLTDLMGDRSFS